MALRLPMSGGFDSFANVRDIPFIARHATRSREEVTKLLKLPSDKPLVLTSFGTYGVPGLDTDALAKLKRYVAITVESQPVGRTSTAISTPDLRVLPKFT